MALTKHKFKLKDGTVKTSTDWYYRFMYRGKIHFGSTKTSNKTVAQRVHNAEHNKVVAKYELGETQSITIGAALQNYLATMVKSGQYENIKTYVSKLLGKKRDNKVQEEMYVKVYGFDGDAKLESLTNADVQKLITGRRSEDNADGTILAELSYLKQAIELNSNLGHPVPAVDFAKLKKDNKVKPSKGRLRFLSEAEEAKLLEQLHPDTPINGVFQGAVCEDDIRAARQDMHDLVCVLLGTGARYDEIASLEWKSVDLKAKTIDLYRSKVNNESVIHLSPRTFTVLQRRHENRDGSEYVFTARDGGPRKYSTRPFKSACKRAGIKGITLHSLRHTTASRLVSAGVSLYAVQKMLGHATQVTTQRYAHLAPEHASKQAATVLA